MKTKKPSKLLLRKNQNMIKIENNATEIFEEKKTNPVPFLKNKMKKLKLTKNKQNHSQLKKREKIIHRCFKKKIPYTK